MQPYDKWRWGTMLRTGLMLCLTGLLLASCRSVGAGDFCLVAVGPIRVSPADKLTDETAREVLTFNNKGAALCGW